MKKTWDEVIKDALAYHLHKENYAYFYGAKGQVLTDAVMEQLWQSEPDYFKRYSEGQKKMIFDWSRGRVGYDCSGFISAVTGCRSYSGGILAQCRDIITDISAGVAGSILWLPGHVGLDIGYGYYLQTGKELESIEIGRIKEGAINWQKSGMLTGYIDYTGADAR